eukprot:TRINITY_DN10763_c0_g1_i2.p1 TRINITY_DN10763_c0_g1~~TRINITY_DN10763_c0_g1_i2.p1  ORF type:complete len:587 (+),score=119.17 TRINITY_DN10763_c0_g1_i2:131-1891(+)
MIRRPPRSTLSSSSAASDVYKRQVSMFPIMFDCWASWPSTGRHIYGPLILSVVVFVLSGGLVLLAGLLYRRCSLKKRKHRVPHVECAVDKVVARLTCTGIAIQLVLWPHLAEQALKMFACTPVDSTLYNVHDFGVVCTSATHVGVTIGVALPVVILFLVLIPWKLLRLAKHSLGDCATYDTRKHRLIVTQGFGAVYLPYLPDLFWYFGVVHGWKLSLVSVGVLISPTASSFGGIGALLILNLAVGLHFHYSPYYYDDNDRLEAISLMSLTAYIVFAMLAVESSTAGTLSGVVMCLIVISFVVQAFQLFRANNDLAIGSKTLMDEARDMPKGLGGIEDDDDLDDIVLEDIENEEENPLSPKSSKQDKDLYQNQWELELKRKLEKDGQGSPADSPQLTSCHGTPDRDLLTEPDTSAWTNLELTMSQLSAPTARHKRLGRMRSSTLPGLTETSSPGGGGADGETSLPEESSTLTALHKQHGQEDPNALIAAGIGFDEEDSPSVLSNDSVQAQHEFEVDNESESEDQTTISMRFKTRSGARELFKRKPLASPRGVASIRNRNPGSQTPRGTSNLQGNKLKGRKLASAAYI